MHKVNISLNIRKIKHLYVYIDITVIFLYNEINISNPWFWHKNTLTERM